MKLRFAFVFLALCLTPQVSYAQLGTLPAVAFEKASLATVKVVAVGSDGRGSTGSGVVIDRRGYVLTNFHVVGEIDARRGSPGALISASNRIYVTFADSAAPAGRQRWTAAVVRADLRRDLALLRIIADGSGAPVSSADFAHLEFGSLRGVSTATPAWAVGFASGSRQLRDVVLGIAGIETNALRLQSWLRLRGSVDGGFSGGPLVDANGRLLGILSADVSGTAASVPIRRARPASSVPSAWLQALRNGRIFDMQIEGLTRLRIDEPVRDTATGDAVPGSSESHFFLLPPDRPTVVRCDPALSLNLWDGRGRKLRGGVGSLTVQNSDPRGAVLSLDFPPGRIGATRYTLWAQSPTANLARPVGRGAAQNMGEFGLIPDEPSRNTAAGPSGVPNTGADNPFFTLPTTQRVQTPSTVASTSTVVRGRLVDAISGRTVAGGSFVIGQPGVDIRSHLGAFLSGRMSETAFRARLIGSARSDIYGRFELSGLPRGGGTFPAAAVAPGYSPAVLPVQARWHDRVIELGTIQLTR